MAKGLGSLARSMRRRAQAIPTIASEIAKDGAESALRELIEVTPVDTSEAISNWQVGINSKPLVSLMPHTMGRRGSSRSASSDRSLQLGLDELKLKQPGQTIYLSNTAPYIGDLDRGTSVQFPGGFIPRALIVFRLAAKAAAKRLLK